jgi:TolB-like protein/tetratricopeptide (TPR) repeat protein
MIRAFFQQLRRRKVLRVAGAYAVVGWGILRVAEAVFPLLGLPEWTVLFVSILLVLGLPVSLIITWAFVLTPDGIQRVPAPAGDGADPDAVRPPETPAGRWLDAALLAAVVAVVVISAVQIASRSDASLAARGNSADAASAPAAHAMSVAVLPFLSFSDDAQDHYFADGLTEELINGLVQIPGLLVPGRTSSFYFKNRQEDLRDIGRKLGVAHVVEGSVRRVGNRLRVTVQLVSAGDGFHLWSQTYDRAMDDIFAIQHDISMHVAASLKRTLLTDHVHVPEAQESPIHPRFLIATALLRDVTPESLTRARGLFEEILGHKPDHVEALAGYAAATMLLAGAFLTIDFEPAAAAAVAAVERALAIDPQSVSANLAAGRVYHGLAFRTDEHHYLALAERALARAMDLAPNDPEVLLSYGRLLAQLEQWEAALEVTQRGVELDPLDPSARHQLALAFRGVGQLDDAERELRALLTREPGYVAGRLELGELLMESGRFDGALPELQTAHRSRTSPRATFALANVYLNLGMADEVRETLRELDYAPLSQPLGDMVLHMMGADHAAALAFAEEQLARTNDRIWRPIVVLLALNEGDLPRARRQLRLLEPAALAPDADVSRLAPGTVLLAANLLDRESRSSDAARLLERFLARLDRGPGRYDPVEHKVWRVHALAQLGRIDEALAQLAAARRQGYRMLHDFDNFLRLERYPTMAQLRQDRRFQAALEAIESDNRALAKRLAKRLAAARPVRPEVGLESAETLPLAGA